MPFWILEDDDLLTDIEDLGEGMGGRPDDDEECRGEDQPLGDAGALCPRELECALDVEDLFLLGDSTLVARFDDL